MFRTKISTKGQLVIPAKLRQADGIAEGDVFRMERLETGNYHLIRESPAPNHGVVRWLMDCPVKDWADSIDSESTDTIQGVFAEGQDEIPG